MRIQLIVFSMFALGVLTTASLTSVEAQENDKPVKVQIINQDGETVRDATIRIQGQGLPAGIGGGKAGRRIKVERNQDGKFVITAPDGTQQEIDIDGATSVTVNQSTETIDNNGQKETKSVGKAIIVGPDGKRHEIDLGGGEGALFALPGFEGMASVERLNNSFMIGVNCEPVSEALRAQLQLDDKSGLIVVNVVDDSPAGKAGIQKHDILMNANDRELATNDDLVEAVQTAGQEDSNVSLILVRGGKEQDIDVTPTKRTGATISLEGMPKIFRFPNDGEAGGFNMKFRQMGPGIIVGQGSAKTFEGNFDQDMQSRMEAMQKQMDEMHREMLKRFEEDNNN